MITLDFAKIAPRNGSPNDAFEELCCQLARRAADKDSVFDRFRGTGGDGGVECLERTSDGRVIGWQAKFVFEITGLLRQADDSLGTALDVYPDLTEFILCFPFNPTPPTRRKTKTGKRATSEIDKLNAWLGKWKRVIESRGRRLIVTLKPAASLEDLLHEHDTKGGIREYFFNVPILSPSWFRNHIESAAKSAEPRYSADLKIDTPLYQWFEGFEAGPSWRQEVQAKLESLAEAFREFGLSVSDFGEGGDSPDTTEASELSLACLEKGRSALRTVNEASFADWDKATKTALQAHRKLAQDIRESMPNKRWENSLSRVLESLSNWLQTPKVLLGFHRAFVLAGDGGSGKTHGICDMALKRLEAGACSCILFGHQFDGQPTDWARAAESLGLPSSLGQDRLLDALNAAAEASGHMLIIWVDAINETIPRDYWRKRLKGFAGQLLSRPFLRLCVSCRTSFAPICLPEDHNYPVFEHYGFAGMEHLACKRFFEHYGLTPPLAPILQPELSNPLYLKLVCQTLRVKGLTHLPPGWLGLASVIRAFLEEKEKRFAEEHSVSAGAGSIGKSLHALALRMAELKMSRLPYSEAQTVIVQASPHASQQGVLDWLIKADLVIEDGPADLRTGSFESNIRLAFERLSDFLLASGMMPGPRCRAPKAALADSEALRLLFANGRSVKQDAGLVASLSLLFAERWGIELPLIIEDAEVRSAVLPIAMEALSWRSPTDFNNSTAQLAHTALIDGSTRMRDALLIVSCQPSMIDALWLHSSLQGLPIWKRDPFWCSYLLQSFEERGTVASLINAAENPHVGEIGPEIALRWAIQLCWFSAAADRRVKDKATRALTKVFCAHTDVIIDAVMTMDGVDDDDPFERALLSAYGALLIKRNRPVAELLARTLLAKYQAQPERYQNAQIRDLFRCIAELSKHLGGKLGTIPANLPTRRRKITWLPSLPTKAELNLWDNWRGKRGAMQMAAHSSIADDFNHYSIGCLGPWMERFNKIKIGQWISKHLADTFHLGCGSFDEYEKEVTSYGFGRDKPVWAERIGKKYQWIALNRLASNLHDKYSRKRDGWDPKPIRIPLILQEERKFDPSIPTPVLPDPKSDACWWSPLDMNLVATQHLSFSDWAEFRDDLPSMDDLMRPNEANTQRWLVLHQMGDWSEYSDRTDSNAPYRSVWFHLRSYLVPTAQFEDVRAAIAKRNYFERWLPEGGSWLHCYVGEYPWATSFNTEPDSYMGAGSELRNTDLTLIHTANVVNCEWAYDGSLERNINFRVPAKPFFKGRQLRWDGQDGFETISGKTIFRDPHVTEGGSSALIADTEMLPKLLSRLGYRLVWTLVGGKDVLRQPHNEHTPTEVFSQFAYLDEHGDPVVEPRRFYLDNQQDINPDPNFVRSKLRSKVEVTANSIRFNW